MFNNQVGRMDIVETIKKTSTDRYSIELCKVEIYDWETEEMEESREVYFLQQAGREIFLTKEMKVMKMLENPDPMYTQFLKSSYKDRDAIPEIFRNENFPYNSIRVYPMN